MILALLAFSFFIGFAVESMIGLGGTLISYSFLLFFIDIKTLIVSTIILPIIASAFILLSDIKSISWRVLATYLPICMIGVPIGIWLFEYLPNEVVLKILAIFLILFGFRSAFFGEIIIKGLLGKVVVFVSGILHGLVGTGGPVAIIGMKNALRNKGEIRVTMAVFFIVLNIFRIIQLSFYNEISDFIVNFWVAIPMAVGIFVGHFLHKKIQERQFRVLLSIFFIIAGLLLIIR